MVNKIEILTPNGWSKFDGVVKYPEQYVTTIVLNNCTISGTNDHNIFYSPTEKKTIAEYKIGDVVYANDKYEKIINIYKDIKKSEVYDILNVEKNNQFYCNSILVSNCEFMGESDTLIDGVKLKNLSKSVLSKKPLFTQFDFNFYKELEVGKRYIIGVDTCMGSSGDYAAIQIFEFPGFIQIAEWTSNTKDQNDQLRIVRDIIKWMYSTLTKLEKRRPEIYWSVENNSSAEGFICTLKERGGPNIYIPEAQLVSDDGKRYGIATTSKSRPLACSKLKIYLENGQMIINSKAFIRQLNFFINIGGKYQAKSGENDDLITSAMVAIMVYLKMKDKVNFDQPYNSRQVSRIMTDFNLPFLYTQY